MATIFIIPLKSYVYSYQQKSVIENYNSGISIEDFLFDCHDYLHFYDLVSLLEIFHSILYFDDRYHSLNHPIFLCTIFLKLSERMYCFYKIRFHNFDLFYKYLNKNGLSVSLTSQLFFSLCYGCFHAQSYILTLEAIPQNYVILLHIFLTRFQNTYQSMLLSIPPHL